MPVKLLCRLDGNSTSVVSEIPMGCSGIAWCQTNKSILISDTDNSKVLSVTQDGSISVIADQMSSPRGICFDESRSRAHIEQGSGNILIKTVCVPSGRVMEVPVEGTRKPYDTVRKIRGVSSMRSNGLCFSPSSRKIIMPYDSDNVVISISNNGKASREVGGGNKGYSFGTDITKISMYYPCGVAINQRNALFIADTGNHIIREFTSEMMTGRIAGVPMKSGYKDGNGHDSLFTSPVDMVASNEYVYVVDAGKMIRKIDIITMNVSTAYTGNGLVESITRDNKGIIYFTEVLYAS